MTESKLLCASLEQQLQQVDKQDPERSVYGAQPPLPLPQPSCEQPQKLNMGSASSIVLCSSSSSAISQPAPPPQSLYCHHCRGVISSGPSAFLAGQGRFGQNGAGLAECPRCRGNFVEVLTEHERRRIQVASPLRQVRVAATNIMPGRRVTANDIVYTFFLFDNDVHRDLFRDSDLDAAISQSLDEAAGTPQKATSRQFLDTMQKEGSTVLDGDIAKQVCCPICDEGLSLNEGILRLPCKHVFHDSCLSPWLADHNTCPICRSELPPEPEEVEPRKASSSEIAMAAAAARRSFTHMVSNGDPLLLRPPTPVMEAAGIQALNARLGVEPQSPPPHSPAIGALNALDAAESEAEGVQEGGGAEGGEGEGGGEREGFQTPRPSATTVLEEADAAVLSLGLEPCASAPGTIEATASAPPASAQQQQQPQSESLDDLINEVTTRMSSAPVIPLDLGARPATSSRLGREAARQAPMARPATQAGTRQPWPVGDAAAMLETATAEGVQEGITDRKSVV